MPKAWEGDRGKCPGGNRPLHSLCLSICNLITDCTLTTAKALLRQFYCTLWIAQEDPLQPAEGTFKIELIADLCRLTGTQKLQTSPYHPQTNGQCGKIQFHPDWYAEDTLS